MSITDAFVLPEGVILQPASEMHETLRAGIGSQENDFVISRPGARAYAKVIEAEGAAFVEEFRRPNTIAKAVAKFSRATAVSPDRLLVEVLPMLSSLIAAGFLVPANSPVYAKIEPSIVGESELLGNTVLRCIQSLIDTEVYHVRTPRGSFAALKIGRSDKVKPLIQREAHALSVLEPLVTPKLLESGQWNSRPYIVTDWFHGSGAPFVFAELREHRDVQSQREMLRLAGAILRAYATLHRQGLLHGDVHPHNVLIDRRESVGLVDFGLSQSIAETNGAPQLERGGIGFFFEPEFASAMRNHSPLPPATPRGEQYAVAALLYFLMTGSHYLDFSLQHDELLRQICEEPMVPLSRRGLESWPEAERVLERALDKDPQKRFSSMDEFAESWSAVSIGGVATAPDRTAEADLTRISTAVRVRSSIDEFIKNDGALDPPTASVNYGSAGLAYALYRIACARDDPEALASADLWANKAVQDLGNETALHNKDFDITPKTVASASLYHGRPGVFLVQALIARGRGDPATQYAALQSAIEALGAPTGIADVALGSAGALLGCAFSLDLVSTDLSGLIRRLRDAVVRTGSDVCAVLWDRPTNLTNLGIAHGTAGLGYATLRWCAAAEQPFPDRLEARLRYLADCAEPSGRGLQWRWNIAETGAAGSYMAGWCNGSAGFVFLWTQAYAATQQPVYLDLAEGAAWHTWENPSTNASLCCGATGQAYALLNFYRSSGEAIWLKRARQRATFAGLAAQRQAAAGANPREWRWNSLFKGDAGLAVLHADLERPDEARMPMFERV